MLKRADGQARHAAAPPSAEEQTILVAHDLSPADVIQFKQHHFGAFLTDLGGVTSHTAIVARSLNVPAVVATHNARSLIRDGEMLIVDGSKHVVIVNPDRAVLAEYRLKQDELELARQKLQAAAQQARRRRSTASTSSCTPTSSCPTTSTRRWRTAPTGIGLFRSEFLFLNRTGLPSRGRAVRGLPQGRRRRCRASR